MIASKMTCDNAYSNKSWCVISQEMFPLGDINLMEREMCGYLEWDLDVKPDDLQNFEAMVCEEYGSASTTPVPVAVSTPRQPAEPRKQSTADFNANAYPSPILTCPLPSHSNSTSPTSSTFQEPPTTDSVKVLAKDIVPAEQTVCAASCLMTPISSQLRLKSDDYTSASTSFMAERSTNTTSPTSCQPPDMEIVSPASPLMNTLLIGLAWVTY
jgi:hypothetical protein